MSNAHFRRHRLMPACLTLAMLSIAEAAVVAPPAGAFVDGVSPASVIEVSPSGLGHVNIVPYYTVEGGIDTYINITNTDTRNGKAIKLRFLSAGAGDTVFSLTVLLSPGDRWAAALTLDTTTGLPRLVHNDRSCTLPADVQHVFRTARVDGAGAGAARSGHVEVIALADIPPRTAVGDPPLFKAIQQVAGVAPCTTADLATLAVDASSYSDARAKGLEVPTTGLMTRWTLIHVPRAVSFTGVATALEARVAAGGAAGYGNVVLFPQTDEPVASLAAVRSVTADPLLRGGVSSAQMSTHPDIENVVPAVTALANDFPDLSTPYLPAGPASSNNQPGAKPRLQAYAVSKAMATTSFANDFVFEPLIAARTEWVVTMPTRRYEAAVPGLAADGNGSMPLIYTDLTVDDRGLALSAGTANFFWPGWLGTSGLSSCYSLYQGPSVVRPITPSIHNRTGTIYAAQEAALSDFRPDPNGIPPIPPGPNPICGNSAIVKLVGAGSNTSDMTIFNNNYSVTYVLAYDPKVLGGWARFATPGAANAGLPLIGFAAMELFNAAATPGMAGGYGQTFPHTTTRPD